MTAAEHEDTNGALKRIGDCIRRRGTVLDLSRLGLRSLPPRISQLPGLTELKLAGNRFASLPPGLDRFPLLALLDLSGNPLDSLPPEIGLLAGLTRLDVTGTPLRSLPGEIGRLTSLTRLYLDHNRLDSLPPEIGWLAGLARLHLSHNQLAGLPAGLAGLAALTRLDLSHNRLATVPEAVCGCERLTVLDLSHNPLESLPPAIGRLARLTVLRLAHTRLATLPDAVGELAALTELDLAGAPLRSLPAGLRGLGQLERLFLHDCPALGLPACILGPDRRVEPAAGHAAAGEILEFCFGGLSGRARPLNEAKLVLLGPAGAGKTTVVQALRNQPFHEREPGTPGVARCQWAIEGSGEPPVTARVWDFSGQAVTHPLHPLFLGPRDLCVVVLAGRDGDEGEDADYWLNMVRAAAADAPEDLPSVIVALNQWQVAGRRPVVDRDGLRRRFPCIRGFVEMDCKAKKGIPALKAALARELERMPWVREPFATEWDAVREALVARGGVVTAAGFGELCRGHGVDDAARQQHLAAVLHQLGIALGDPADGALLDADWLAHHLYPLLHRAEARAGVLDEDDAGALLPPDQGPDARACLMRVLERRGLAIAGRSAAGTVWVLPHAQPAEAPAAVDAAAPADARAELVRFVYQVLPAGLVARLVARRLDFVEEAGGHRLHWRHGVVLVRSGARAVFRIDPERRQLTVTVTGPVKARRQFAGLCRAELRDLHAALPGIGAAEAPGAPG